MLNQVKEFFTTEPRPPEDDILKVLGPDFQIKAVDALACAYWGFITHWNQPEQF